jgi:hypothetical protein
MMSPPQKPHRSNQAYCTPEDFLHAVRANFGIIAIDLAASGPNVCDRWIGPGSALAEDALAAEWFPHVPMGGKHLAWLNPSFGDIAPWARKCVAEGERCKIVMLTPSSLGANWYCDIVQGHALTLVVRPRLTFVGESSPYPKDIALHLFGFQMVGLGTWRWK